MSRVLCIGDPHFKISNVTESLEMMTKIYEVLDREKFKFIVVMGDTLDKHEIINMVPLNLAIKFLKKLSEYAKTYVLIGNHDRRSNTDFLSDYHPFPGLNSDNLIVVNKLLIDGDYIFVPYVYIGRFMEALNEGGVTHENIKNYKYIFAHQEFFGVKMGAMISVVGDKYPEDYPPIISGHIHDYYRPQKNIVYVGTPMQHAFGDRDDKTVSIFDLDYTGEFTEFMETRVDLELTKKVIVKLKCQEVLSWIPPTKYLIKLVIEGTSNEIKAIQKLEYIKELIKFNNIKVVYKAIDPEIFSQIHVEKVETSKPYALLLRDSITEPRQKELLCQIFPNLRS